MSFILVLEENNSLRLKIIKVISINLLQNDKISIKLHLNLRTGFRFFKI